MDLPIEECTVNESIACGFKQDWISGTGEGLAFEMSSGGGCGNKHLQISITKDGETKYFKADMEDFLKRFLSSAISQ